MTAAAAPTVFARIPMPTGESLHVSADVSKGRRVIDLRIFAPVTLAKAMMPTGRAVSIDPTILPVLIKALRAAYRSPDQTAVIAPPLFPV